MMAQLWDGESAVGIFVDPRCMIIAFNINSIIFFNDRPLPDEVRERLATIIMVREAQAGLKEALDRIDTDIGQLGSRIDQIEAADRQEVARLIEQQTQLIKVTLHQVS